MEEVYDPRSTISMLVRACQTENLPAISAAVEEAEKNHSSLFREERDR
jgi:hypothetical protein